MVFEKHMQLTKKRIINHLLRFSGLILLVLIFTGCCSVVAKSGDAKILQCYQLIHSPGIESYRMVLPSISLAQMGTNTLSIKNLPVYLAGQFSYDLFIPYDGNSAKDVPWKDVKITIVFRNSDNLEFYRRTLALRVDPLGAPDNSNLWNVGWINREDCSETNTTFDIVIAVEHPSRKSTDRITLNGFAFVHKP